VVYDPTNTFARILKGELPCEPLFDNEFALAISDTDPQAPAHALVLAKGHYEDLDQFTREATPEQLSGFFRAISETARCLGLEATGYRLVVNKGVDAGQEVAHAHVHVLGGMALGPIVAPARAAGRARTSREASVSLPGEAGERREPRRPAHDPKSKPRGGPEE
jgi:diadenosine tetraphosphate (Ap4A) HIT family hydrolase